MTISKLRFGDALLSMAKTRCKSDVLTFDPTTQKLREILDILQKTASVALGPSSVSTKPYTPKYQIMLRRYLTECFEKMNHVLT